jgi:hypothetical protein
MNVSGIIWLRDIVDKLLWKHRVTPDEVVEVLHQASRYRFNMWLTEKLAAVDRV